MFRLAALLAATSLCWAQKFDVASVKTNVANDRIVTIEVSPDGRFTARGYTLALLIQRAYAVRYGYVKRGPGWAYEDRFDIAAKASVSGRFTEAQLRPMLAELLATRFRLKVRNERKDEPGYALEAGRGAARLTRSAEVEEHPDNTRMTNEAFTAQGIGMPDFARFLGNKLGALLADETKLEGLFDIHFRWEMPTGQVADAQPVDEAADKLHAVFRAVEQQLGLKVRPKKVAIPAVVIDHAEKPRDADN
ncbi:MAG: TIGR03435 family protein [Candidatus Solibacter sp.]